MGLGRLLALVGLLLAAGSAQAAAPSTAEAMGLYFTRPNGVEAFRALTGRGDPHIPPETANGDLRWVSKDHPDAALYGRIAPKRDDYSMDFVNCRASHPVQVLKARIAQLGERHPYVDQWVRVQRAVFQVCGHEGEGGPPKVILPPPLAIQDPALAALQAQDRAYQAASLAFYQGEHKAALAQFQAIAKSASPHRLTARYMAVAIRAGSTPRWYADAEPMVPMAQALAEAQALVADPQAKPVQPLAQQLLGWIGANVADAATRKAQVQATLAALQPPAERLAADPVAARRYALALADIDHLHAWDPPGWQFGAAEPPPEDYTASRAMQDAAKTDPLAAWVLFPVSYVHARPWAPFDQLDGQPDRGWTALAEQADKLADGDGPEAFAWARVKLALAQTYDPDGWDAIDGETAGAARGDPQQAAALATDFYHQVRLALSGIGWAGEERDAAFAKALAEMQAFPLKPVPTWEHARREGLQYLMTAGRLAEARRWRDALYPADGTITYDSGAVLQILAEDEAHFAAALARKDEYAPLPLQNGLSIAALTSLAKRPEVPQPLRARFARTAWGRTYALGRTVDPGLDRLMRELNPQMTATWTSPAGRAVKPGDRRALLDVLRSPGVNILIVDEDRDAPPSEDGEHPGLTKIDLYNHDDDNWWCRWKPRRHETDREDMLKGAFFGDADLQLAGGEAAYGLRARLEPALRASWAFRAQDAAETAALSAIPCAPKVLSERVIDWVKHPGWFGRRDGQAEALALAVKTTRYGCYSDGPHGKYSREAWVLLHERFPDTEWAKKTKYWFNCPLGGKECPARGDEAE